MKRAWLLALPIMLLSAVSALAQGWCYSDFAAGNIVLNGTHVAQPLSGATVTVCTSAGAGIPCTPKAGIFSDVALTVPEADPITADSNGNFTFCAAQGTYIITIQEAGFTSYSYKIALPPSTAVTTGIEVNGTPTTNSVAPFLGNFNSTTPAAPAGSTNVTFAADALNPSHISASVSNSSILTNVCTGPTTGNYVCSGPYIPSGATVGVVQFASCYVTVSAGSTGPATCALPTNSPKTAGTGLLVEIVGGASFDPVCPPGGTAVISDSLGSSFHTCLESANWSAALAPAAPGSGADTVTVSWTMATGVTRPLWIYVFEVTSNAVDIEALSGRIFPNVTITTVHTNDLLIVSGENGVNCAADCFSNISITSPDIVALSPVESRSGDPIGAILMAVGATRAANTYNLSGTWSNPFGNGLGMLAVFSSTPTAVGPNTYKPLITAMIPGGVLPVSVGHLAATSCTTGASTYSTCTSVVTISPAQADTNYMPICVGITPSDPRALIEWSAATSATTITATVITEGSLSVNFADIWCEAVHP